MSCIICGKTPADYGAVAVLHSGVRCTICDTTFAVSCGVESEEKAHKCPGPSGRPAPSGGATDETRHLEDAVNELVVDHDYGGAFDGRTAKISHPADCDDLMHDGKRYPHEYTVPLAELVNAVRAAEACKHVYNETEGEAAGIRAIAVERARQVLKGFDDLNDQGRSRVLARAALGYGLYPAGDPILNVILKTIWPWEATRLEKIADMPPAEKWAKAGALFAAAIDQVSQDG